MVKSSRASATKLPTSTASTPWVTRTWFTMSPEARIMVWPSALVLVMAAPVFVTVPRSGSSDSATMKTFSPLIEAVGPAVM